MATLLGQKINATYDSLLKTEDNDGITGSLKQITDGVGQTTPLYLSTTEAKIGGNLEITGDLTVGGTTTYVNTDNVTVKDGLVLLANDNVADIIDIGLYGKYNDGTVKYTGLYRDATDGVFKIFDGLATEPTTTVGGGDLADFAAAGGSFSGNLTLTTGKIFVNGAGNNGYINSKGAVAVQVASIDNSRLFRGIDSSVQEVFYVQGTGDVFASGQLIIDSIDASGSVSAFNVTASNAITSGTLNVADAIIHTGDTDTMIEFLANQIKTTTGGVLNINTTPTKTTFYQNVGIGDTPDTLLHIKGSAPSFKIESSDTSASLNIPAGSINFFGGYSNSIEIASIRSIDASSGGVAGQLAFYTSADPDTPTEIMRIDSAGNVLVGSQSAGFTTGSGMEIQRDSASATLRLERITTNTSVLELSADADQVLINSRLSDPIVFAFGAPAVEKMRIDSSGNVGIGISPNEKQELYNTTGTQTVTQYGNLNTGSGAGNGFIVGIESSGNGIIWSRENQYIRFGTNATERMRIDSSGNITQTASDPSFVIASSNAGGYATLSLKGLGTNGTSVADVWLRGIAEGSGAASAFTVYTRNASGSRIERMRIDSSGNVLLNNQATRIGERLNVTGNGIYIEQTDGGVGTMLGAFGSSDVILGAFTSTNVQFRTNNVERARITSGGYLKASNDGVYASSTGTFHEIRNDADGSVLMSLHQRGATNPYGIAMKFNNASPNNTTNYFILAADSTADRFKVYSNGNVVNTNNSYGAISDAKLKENIVDASPKLDDLMQVKIRNYNLIGDDKKQLGVVAQELETIFPAMIDESTDFEEREVELKDENGEIVYETEQVLVSEAIAEELDADGNVITPAQEAVYETVTTDRPVMTTEKVDLGTTTKSVKYSVFVPILVKAMQEQQEIIQSQGDLINKLEARIAALEAR